MRTMHLFSGAGGGLLADLILGHEPIVAVDSNDYCCEVLRERVSDGWFPDLSVTCADVRTVDFSKWAGNVDCIAAGFPCQDISCAGRGAGIHGERSGLFREVMRAVDAVRPRFVFLENSPRIRTKGRTAVVTELVARGYSWRDGVLAAADVGAGHQRKRWWCLASDLDFKRRQAQPGQSNPSTAKWGKPADCAEVSADHLRDRLQVAIQQGWLSSADSAAIQAAARYTAAYNWSLPPDAGICRVVDGMASRVDRIKAAGNGQVPLQAAAAWLLLGGPI